MKICRFIGHKWSTYQQYDYFTPDKKYLNNLFGVYIMSPLQHCPFGHPAMFSLDKNGDVRPQKYLKTVRLCKRCYKKQYKNAKVNHSNTSEWIDDKLTTEELRDLKLKDLLS
jgi:hypothetical protein